MVSSPSVDKNSRFGEFDVITARFFECAAFYCHLIGRYTENEEAKILKVKEICPNVKTYKQFNALITEMLDKDVNVNKYKELISENATSARLKYIMKCLKSLNLIN